MRMHLMHQVKQLEARAQQMSERELCPHLPPVIHHADGTVENELPHDCGLPRLVITVSYSDRSDRRAQNVLLDLFEEWRRKRPDVPPEMLVEWINEDCSPTQETQATLRERVSRDS